MQPKVSIKHKLIPRKDVEMKKRFQSLNRQITVIIATLLLVLVTLYMSKRYFYSKEIELLTESCQQAGGKIILETNSLSMDYSFECQKK
ncbi:hypothetical protein P9C93_07115 [Bacillus safensis]|uniref:hypothetical protein n=1 Tax=Bacillus safensis TaxID=561879 RepID=UPI002DB7C4BE|nr:hypothetical protein [Bacillus safensis]MEC1410355.1 hypothetical protein [Bacillus safensis]